MKMKDWTLSSTLTTFNTIYHYLSIDGFLGEYLPAMTGFSEYRQGQA